MNPNDAFDRWAIRSNLARIDAEGLDPAGVVAHLRAGGYERVADGVLDAIAARTPAPRPDDDAPECPECGREIFADPAGNTLCPCADDAR